MGGLLKEWERLGASSQNIQHLRWEGESRMKMTQNPEFPRPPADLSDYQGFLSPGAKNIPAGDVIGIRSDLAYD